jgi:hypothetical protein
LVSVDVSSEFASDEIVSGSSTLYCHISIVAADAVSDVAIRPPIAAATAFFLRWPPGAAGWLTMCCFACRAGRALLPLPDFIGILQLQMSVLET